MGRSFHNVHVRADDASPVVDALWRYLDAEGFEPVRRGDQADRTVRLSSPRRGWISLDDDGGDATRLAGIVTEESTRAAVEAYCEASAIVWMALHRGGRLVGGWGIERDLTPDPERDEGLPAEPAVTEPSQSDLDALGVRGLDAAALSARWHESIREVFPEAALAVAAKALGLDVDRVFGERQLRATILRARRTRSRWTPRFEDGPPRVGATARAPDGAFVGHDLTVDLSLVSLGGAARRVELEFAWREPEANGLVTLRRAVLADGRAVPLEARGPTTLDLALGAALTGTLDRAALTRRELDRANALSAAATAHLRLEGRAHREGRGTLDITARLAGSAAADVAVALEVHPRPWRPRRALPTGDTPADERRFLALQTRALRFATVIFAGGLAEAWGFARAHIAQLDRPVGGLVVGRQVVAHDLAQAVERLDALSRAQPPPPWISLHAPYGCAFGNLSVEPYRAYEGEEPAFALTVTAEPDDDATLPALCDEAMRAGVALSALAATWERAPQLSQTVWEDLTLPFTDATRFRSWHTERVRGIDHDGLWLGRAHLARVDLSTLPACAELTPLTNADGARVAARIRVPRDAGTDGLRALELALDPMLPSREAAEAWSALHPGRARRGP